MHKPFAEIFPHFARSPLAVVTYLAEDAAMGFATEWVGIVCETPARLTFALPYGSDALRILRAARQFAVNLPDERMMQTSFFRQALQTCDGGALPSDLSLEAGQRVAAPTIRDCPVSMECLLSGVRENVGQVYVSGQVVSLRLGEHCYGLEERLNLCRLEPFSQRWLAPCPGESEPGVDARPFL